MTESVSESIHVPDSTEEVKRPGKEIQLKVAAASTRYIAARENPHIEDMRRADAMQDLLALARTREGLAALISAQEGGK